MPNLFISELFYSIQGESSYAGLPCIFIRLSGCNLRCKWCDTTYALSKGDVYSLDEIMSFVHKHKVRLVCITGGEPLLQPNVIYLIKSLLNENYKILLETNGSLPINNLPHSVIKVMDLKCPGSGMTEYMYWKNIGYLSKMDEVKFVIGSREDYDWTKDIILKYRLIERCKVLCSPVFNILSPQLLASWILKDHLPVRLQLQLHKYIWGERRGV